MSPGPPSSPAPRPTSPTTCPVARRAAGTPRRSSRPPSRPPPPQYAEPQYAPPPPPTRRRRPHAPDMDAKLAQLAQLGALRDAGVLSDIEFEVQKNKILTS